MNTTLTQLIARWQTDARFMDNIAAWRTLPATPPVYGEWPPSLEADIQAAIKLQGIERLYSHQSQAIASALEGKHTVMVTGTASGKTLGYNAPVLQALRQNPQARALYLFPTKALAQDQLLAFNQLSAGMGKGAPGAAAYDGDTPQSARKKIRTESRVIISNPDMLHAGILPHHPRWKKFLGNLRYIVIDEMHIYRGIFGSHFANVLRRLHRICTFYGATPQFICATATIANPFEHALNLLDLVEPHRLDIITENGAPQAKKHIIFYNPPIIDEQLGMRRGVIVTVNDLARRLLEAKAQTAIFARSRLAVEVLLTYLRDFAHENGWPAETIRGYRGGYLPLARRDIETGLRLGEVRGVVATNALELGVDIGGLNACVLTGYPGTIAGTWQQMGRAGRREGESVALMVASQASLDQFLMAHPSFFFERGAEHARIDPDNLIIALGHLQCAAYELPFEANEPFGRFPNPAELLDHLVSEGQLRLSGERYHWVGQGYPAEMINLRSAGINNVAITVLQDNQTANTIGEIDILSAPRLVYPGAIYLHEGESFLITALDLEGGRADAVPVEVGYYTRATQATDVQILSEMERDETPALPRSRGEVAVSSQVTGFKQIKRYTHETIAFHDLDLPLQAFETSAYWLTLPDNILDKLRTAGAWHRDRLDYGPSALWQARRKAARERDRYLCQHCHAPEPPHRKHDVHHIKPLRLFLEEAARNNVEASVIYPQAHALSNLITLCPACHHRAEAIVQTANAWAGLAHALHNLAPIFLMCDPRDVGVTYDSLSNANQMPTLTLYDSIPMGLGFADQLYDLHEELLASARQLTLECTCKHGCPACVGPPPAEGVDLKAETRILLEAIDF